MKGIFLLMLPLFACEQSTGQRACDEVHDAFVTYAESVLTDSTDLFRGDYPPATRLSCELLSMLQEELKDDSARYCFERLARRYWMEDPHARITHAYIERHRSFALAMAATAHWNEDHRIRGLHELQEYRRTRPMVCTTKEGLASLEAQDRAAVRYLITVLETTPLQISGSENATIHGSYMRMVAETLDRFTGQDHFVHRGEDLLPGPGEATVRQVIKDARQWLAE